MSKSDVEQSSGTDDTNGTTATATAAAAATTKPTFGQRFKAHMKKWWWIYVIAFCCIVLVVVLPIVYVGVPHFANDYINKYNYDETGLSITNPRPDAFHVYQKQSLSMGGGFSGSGHLSAFDATIKMSGSGETMAVFPVPEIKFSKGATFEIDQDLDLSCVDCLSRLAVKAATDKSFSLYATGKPDLKVGGLPTAHLNIKKPMHMDGYNVTDYVNSNGAFNVTSVDLLDPPQNGYNFNATLSLRNPTPFTVEMGHVTFNLSMSGTSLGYVDLPDLKLSQSNSSAQVLGNINKTMLTREAIGGEGNEFGVVTIDVQGYSCEYNGKDIPYYTAAIKAINTSAKVDLLKYASSLVH